MAPRQSETDPHLSAALQVMYGEGGLGDSPIFAGGLINFGYWRRIPASTLNADDRRQASLAFYDVLLEKLGPLPANRILDIGCGRGAGCHRILEIFPSACVVGIDLTFHPLRIAQNQPGNPATARERIRFVQGHASALPFSAGAFAGVISVETVQHLPSVEEFACELWRILSDDGQIAVTTFFAMREKSLESLRGLLPTVANDLDRIVSIDRFLDALAGAGFQIRGCDQVGEHVFPCFDRCIEAKLGPDRWGRRWLQAFEGGLLEYYVIVAGKPA